MSSSERNAKIYGAVETETFMTFEGFCKKIYNTEQQRVEVFIDDEKIDTILANQKISNIEDTYEVFDTEGFCFTYKLPKEYIGEKHKLEFKTIEGEQLVHSPFSTIDNSNEKYNEYCFLENLKENIDGEKIKNIYCPNCIGFLAIEENLKDEEFVKYINQIIKDFPNYKFKALVFNNSLDYKITNQFESKNLKIIKIANIYEVSENIEIYLSNYEKTYKDEYENALIKFLRKYSTDIVCIGLALNRKNFTVYQHEINNPNYYQKFFDNLEYLGFDNNDITKYGTTYHEIYFKKACEKYKVDVEFDINETISKAYVYWNLKLGLSNHEFFKYSLEFGKRFAEIQ